MASKRPRFNRVAVLKAVQAVGFEAERRIIERTVEGAKQHSPKLTGHNASTITFDPPSEPGKPWKVYTQSGYGAYLELGTTKMEPRPYIKRGFEDALREAPGYLANTV